MILISSSDFYMRSEVGLRPDSYLSSLSCLQASEANSISLRPVSGGAEVSWSPVPARPLLPAPGPGAAALLSALRPGRVSGVFRHAAPRPPLLPHPGRHRSSRRPHPRAGHGAPETSLGVSEGLTAEGATESVLLRLKNPPLGPHSDTFLWIPLCDRWRFPRRLCRRGWMQQRMR